MKRWFTSDLHFGHRNVITYCDRPYTDVKEMDADLIRIWNETVAPEDTVWFIGDFGINKKKCLDKELLAQLNGRKFIVPGNHDSFFVRGHENPIKFEEQWAQKYVNAGWSGAYINTYLDLKGGHQVHLSHLPPSNDDDNRYSQFKVPNDPNVVYVHGHLHGHYRKKRNMIDVAFDSELKFLSEDELIAIIEDERTFIPTRLTKKYSTDTNLMLMPFEEEVKAKNLRRVEHEDGLVLYNYTDHCTFERNWNDITRNSRGIIFEKDTGKIVALPFPKFFNVGEMPETRLENLPDEGYTVTDKMDGSLGIIYNYKGQWRVATRGSFSSDQALKGAEILKKYRMDNVPEKLTLLVEIIYPENKIVANYGDAEKLVLLAAVDRERQEECSRGVVETLATHTKIPKVKTFDYTIEEMIELQKTLPKDQEGFVVRFDSGLRVKIKGDEYMRIHRIISHMSPLAVWEHMDDGKVNKDFMEGLPEEYRVELDKISAELEQRYHSALDAFNRHVDFAIQSIGFGSMTDPEYRKKLGLYTQKNKCPHIFAHFLGKPDSVNTWVMKQIKPKGN